MGDHAPARTTEGPSRLLFAGSPATVVERVRQFQEATGVGVIDLMFSVAQISPADVRRSIELFGREVLPRIRAFGESIAGTNTLAVERISLG